MKATDGWCFVASLVVIFVASLVSPVVSAADDVAAAAAAYQRAQTAELNKEHSQAAALYELADRLRPAPAALRGAIRTRMAAGQRAVAATHAENLLRRHPGDRSSRQTAEHVLEKLEPKLARLVIRCGAPCRPVIDGQATGLDLGTDHAVYLEPGHHAIAASFGENVVPARPLVATAGQRLSWFFQRPLSLPGAAAATAATAAAADEAPADRWNSLSPWFFGAAAAVTVGLAATTLWSGLDVLSAHDDYDPSAPDAQQKYESGQDKETRTNILIAATATVAVATVVLAIFTDWSFGQTERPTISLTPNGPGVGYAMRW